MNETINVDKEHPKTQIEVMSNTLDAVTGYAASKGMANMEAALVLILNELRCIHWHFDNGLHIVAPKPKKEKEA